MNTTIWAVSFSPVDGTRNVVTEMAERIVGAAEAQVKEIDFTRKENREHTYEFSEKDLVIFGTPVYAGRIPNKIMPDWKRCFVGNGAGAVAVCTFGNRSYGGALTELHLILQQNGFRVIGKAGVVCQHVFSNLVGTGRPDAADWKEILAFADEIASIWRMEEAAENESRDASDMSQADGSVQSAGGEALKRDKGTGVGHRQMILPEDTVIEPYYTPLKTDGTPAKFLKAKPLTNENCTDCGECVPVCPLGSIDADNPRMVSGICIKCQACIRKCPMNAKYLADEDFLSHVKMLEEHYTSRHENAFFI